MQAGKNSLSKWTSGSAEGRWSSLGPYYAMFPIEFARWVVERFCPKGGVVLDPFCGRGTVPYVSMVSDRLSIGCDVNPVAWLYSKTKTDPHHKLDDVLNRVENISKAIRPKDRKPETEFQKWAWTPQVLGFLNAARRELNWEERKIDRTLLGIMLGYVHAKAGGGLSNQMRQSKAMAPEYAVRWWKAARSNPPDIDASVFLRSRIEWRYDKGLPPGDHKPVIYSKSSAGKFFHDKSLPKANLVFTSPPYCGVTNYHYDNWIRLWAMGRGDASPSWAAKERYSGEQRYEDMLRAVFKTVVKKARKDAIFYIRTDARERTLIPTLDVLTEVLDYRTGYVREAEFKKPTQTALFGDKSEKPGEVDILFAPHDASIPRDFHRLDSEHGELVTGYND